MKPRVLLPALALLAGALSAADKVTVTVSHTLEAARPAETVVVPWPALFKNLGGNVEPDKLIVRDAAGVSLAYQFTNFNPDDRTGKYDEVLFQHDFAAGEKSATFTIERAAAPVPPFAFKVFARHVPERYDDFAFENDRIAHRIYGPGLETDIAGRSRMIGSGIDVWCKRVPYPVIDRWYLRGHDAYHKDNGEGLDFYSAGTTRGAGGTGVWDGSRLRVSHNWKTARVVANGPVRAIFELTYSTWDAGNGATISEVKRFYVDAGVNFHRVESRYSVRGAASVDVAIGLGKMKDKGAELPSDVVNAPAQGIVSRWTKHANPAVEGELGTAAILPAGFTRTLEDEANQLGLAPVKDGETVTYYVGAGWSRSGQFADAAAWHAYVRDFQARLAAPLQVAVSR